MAGRASIRNGAVIAVIATVAVALTVAPKATAAAPCWKRVLADWQADRVVGTTYEPHCYRTALRHLPTDARTYSDAETAIKRAMLAAVRSGPTHGVRGVQTKLRQLEGAREASPAKEAATPVAASEGTRPPIPMLVLIAFAVALLVAAGVGKLRARMQRGS